MYRGDLNAFCWRQIGALDYVVVNAGEFRGGALGASAPPAESMLKVLNLPFFF